MTSGNYDLAASQINEKEAEMLKDKANNFFRGIV